MATTAVGSRLGAGFVRLRTAISRTNVRKKVRDFLKDHWSDVVDVLRDPEQRETFLHCTFGIYNRGWDIYNKGCGKLGDKVRCITKLPYHV